MADYELEVEIFYDKDDTSLDPDIVLSDISKEVKSAIEASRRSWALFSAAVLQNTLDENKATLVKRVLDFGFQDVEELLRLVRLAIEAISL